jgi:DNA-binding MarR family transcriptional regulator
MSLNIDTVQGTAVEPDRHRRLADDLAKELASWSPRERMGAFKAWHRGALSLVHLNVVTVIEAEGPLSMGRLAEALDVSVASVTGIVSRMEGRGLVERRHGEDDRRVVLVHATEAGARIFRDIEGRRREGLARLLEKLTDEQLDGFLAGLRLLRAAHAELVAGAASDRPSDPSGPGGPGR